VTFIDCSLSFTVRRKQLRWPVYFEPPCRTCKDANTASANDCRHE